MGTSPVKRYLDESGEDIVPHDGMTLPAGYALLRTKKVDKPKKAATVKELKAQADKLKPISPPTGYVLQSYTPTALDQLRNSVANSAIGYSIEQTMPALADALNLHPSETVNSPNYAQDKTQLISPQYLTDTAMKVAGSVIPDAERKEFDTKANRDRVEGALTATGNLTSGKNLALLGGTAVAAGLTAGVINPASAQLLSRLVSGGFTLDMLHGLYQQNKEYHKAVDAGDMDAAHKIQGEMGVTGVMAALTGKHVFTKHPFTPVTEPVSRERTNVLHRNAAGEVRQAKGESPTVWLSPDAWHSIMQQIYPKESSADTNGFNIPKQVIESHANDPKFAAAHPEVAELLNKAHQSAEQGGVAVAKKRGSIQDNIRVIREELNHTWQRNLSQTGDYRDHLTPEAFGRLNQIIPDGMRNHLVSVDYDEASHPQMVTEAAAKLMGGDLDYYGVTPEEAASFMKSYLDEVVKQHGTDALNNLKRVRGVAAKAKEAANAEHAGKSTGTNRSADRGNVSGVPEGGQGGNPQDIQSPQPIVQGQEGGVNDGQVGIAQGRGVSSVGGGGQGGVAASPQAVENSGQAGVDSSAEGELGSNAIQQGVSVPTTVSRTAQNDPIIEAFGVEGANKYNSLRKTALDETDMKKASNASSELQKMEDALTPVQRKKLYDNYAQGISAKGEDVVSLEEQAHKAIRQWNAENPLFNREKEKPTWYLKSEKLIGDKMRGPMPGQDVSKMLIAGGVKPEEMHWTGLDDFLKDKKKVTPQEIREHLANNNIQIKEVTKGSTAPKGQYLVFDRFGDFHNAFDNEKTAINAAKEIAGSWTDRDSKQGKYYLENAGTDTKYGSYVLPGGERYREMLLTMPVEPFDPSKVEIKRIPHGVNKPEWETAELYYNGKLLRKDIDDYDATDPDSEQHLRDIAKTIYQQSGSPDTYKSGHWDELNPLAHVRYNDRTSLTYTPEDIQRIESKIQQAMPNYGPKSWGSGVTNLALSKGLITPEEAAEYAHAKGWTYESPKVRELSQKIKATQEKYDTQSHQDSVGDIDLIKKLRARGMQDDEIESYLEQTQKTRGDHTSKAAMAEEIKPLQEELDRERKKNNPAERKLLHVEEVQSDWHQKGRDVGYEGDYKPLTELPQGYSVKSEKMDNGDEMFWISDPEGKRITARSYNKQGSINEALNALNDKARGTTASPVPNAPFKKTWHEMALRRILKMAADKGYDGVSWTPGEDQADRYSLAKQISRLEYFPVDGTLNAFDHSGSRVMREVATPEELPDYIGKEAANKLLQTPRVDTDTMKEGDETTVEYQGKQRRVKIHPDRRLNEGKNSESVMVTGIDDDRNMRWFVPLADLETHTLANADLKVGGEGMKGFYDKIVPDYLNKFGKKYGAKVSETKIPVKDSYDNVDWKPEEARVLHRGDQYQVWAPNKNGYDQFQKDFSTKEEADAYIKQHAEGMGQTKSVQYLPITPEMRQSVGEEGVPLFNRERENPNFPDKDNWIKRGAQDYAKEHGRDINLPRYITPDFRAKDIADAYDEMKHNPADPKVKASYDALKKEIREQWDHATKNMGMKFEPWKGEGQPYNNSAEMTKDVRDNHHLYFFQGGDMPADHPLAEVDPESGLSDNDRLRAVHDLFGHAMDGYEFGKRGEENAWNAHSQMFSPEAIPALTTETKGQNSWVNFGKQMRDAKGNVIEQGQPGWLHPKDRPYADQKAGLLPDRFHYRIDTPISFISPNVKDLDLKGAAGRIEDAPHKMLKNLSDSLAESLNLKPKTNDAIGHWEGGAENSLIHHFPMNADSDAIRYHDANLAMLGNQNAWAAFFPKEGGADDLFVFDAPKGATPEQIAESLSKHGVEQHTMEPHPDGVYTVYIGGNGEDAAANVSLAANEIGATNVEHVGGDFETRGNNEDRGKAVEEHLRTIEEYERVHPEWRKVREAFESRPDYNTLHRITRGLQEEPLFNREQVKTPEFKNWFGESAVVDEQGEPKVLYHGTTGNFTAFAPGRGSQLGSHFGTPEQANARVKGFEDYGYKPQVIPVYLSIKNPLRLTDYGDFSPSDVAPQLKDMGIIDENLYNDATEGFGKKQDLDRKLKNAIKKKGYDGVVYLNRREGSEADDSDNDLSDEDFKAKYPDAQESWIAFSPTQVKSATGNNGSFDPADPSILRNREKPKDTPSAEWSSPKTISREDAIKLLRDANEKGKNKDSDSQDDFGYIRQGQYVKVSAPLSDLDYIEQNPDREEFYAAVPGKFPPVYGSFGKNSLRTHLEERNAPQVAISNGNHRSRAAELRGDKSIDVLMHEEDYDRYVKAKQEHGKPSAEQDSPTDLDVNTIEEGSAEKSPEPVAASTGTGPTTVVPIQGGTQLASAPVQTPAVPVPKKNSNTVASSIEKGTPGECFSNARKWAWDHEKEGAVLVHGKAKTQNGKLIDHAWVELGDEVVDPTVGIRMPKDEYYRQASATPMSRYAPDKAMANMVRAGHQGPWTEQDLSPTKKVLPLAQLKAMAAGLNPVQPQVKSVRDLMAEAKKRMATAMIP